MGHFLALFGTAAALGPYQKGLVMVILKVSTLGYEFREFVFFFYSDGILSVA
jgi:hypothetical protein